MFEENKQVFYIQKLGIHIVIFLLKQNIIDFMQLIIWSMLLMSHTPSDVDFINPKNVWTGHGSSQYACLVESFFEV